MKIILTQEVSGLGSPGDIIEVKDGYGRNYLLPQGLAIGWTKGGEKQVESIKKARGARQVRDLDHAKEIKAKLEGSPIDLKVRAGETGRLFGSVTVNELILGVNIALGSADVGDCEAFDENGDGMVGINELITAVNNALDGCPTEG